MLVLLAFRDDALGARIAGRLLAAGLPADAAEPGPAVLAAVRDARPSVVLTDARRDDPARPWLTQLLRGTDVATVLVAGGAPGDHARAETGRTDGFARVLAPDAPDFFEALDRAAAHGPPPATLFYRALLDTAREMFALVDADVRLLFVSPALAEQAGVPAEALVGRTPIPFVHPDDAERGGRTLARLCGTPGARAHGEIRLRCVGGYRTFDTYGQNRLDEPHLGAVVLAARDVTERRRAEDERRTSEGRLRALVGALPDNIARIHRHGAYRDVKRGGADGLLPDGPLDAGDGAGPERTVFDVLPDPLARRTLSATGEALATGAVQTFEYEVDGADAAGGAAGERGVREARVVPSGPDEVLAVVRDVTRERRAAERESAREAQFRALFQASPDAIVVASPDGHVLDANAAAERLYGRPSADLAGRPLAHLAAAHEHAGFAARFDALASGARTFDEWTAAGAGGAGVPVEVRAARVVYEGADALLLHLRDAADRIAREAALRNLTQRLEAVREDERTRIAREVHDVLGQALTALRIDAVGLERGADCITPAAQGRLGRMRALIDETIGTVRRIATELRPGILDDLGLAAALDWQARDFQARTGLDVRVEADEAAPYPDRDRATALFRIFQELLTNVARHADARRVAARLVRERGGLVLTVEDDGVGLPPGAERRAGHLGLLGIRERVRPFGGAVAFERPPGGGTRVVVRVPEAVGTAAGA